MSTTLYRRPIVIAQSPFSRTFSLFYFAFDEGSPSFPQNNVQNLHIANCRERAILGKKLAHARLSYDKKLPTKVAPTSISRNIFRQIGIRAGERNSAGEGSSGAKGIAEKFFGAPVIPRSKRERRGALAPVSILIEAIFAVRYPFAVRRLPSPSGGENFTGQSP